MAPHAFVRLDRIFAVALKAVLPKDDEITRQVHDTEQMRIEERSLPLSGPQILRRIIETFRTTTSLMAYYSHKELAAMTWLGDGPLIGMYMRRMRRFFSRGTAHVQ